jgi:hypothetical protein
MPKFARSNSYNGRKATQKWTGDVRFATQEEVNAATADDIAVSPATLSVIAAGVQMINNFAPILNNFNFTNTGGINVGAGPGFFSAGINVDGVVTQIVANQVTVQRSSASAVPNAAVNGVAHFDSAQFSVDADGFVQSLASVAFVWQDSGPVAMAITNGYFATAAGVYSLPIGTLDGQTIEIIDNVGGGVVVTASPGQTIRIQNVQSGAGGTATSSQFGDALRLIFRASISEWQCCAGAGGNWLLA